MALVPGGAFSSVVNVPAAECIAIPAAMSFTDAAGSLEAFATAWDALFRQAGLKRGQTALIHAVASSVGLAAVQLCRAFGVQSIGTSRSAAKLERASRMGLDHGVLVGTDGRFADGVRALTGGAGVNGVLELVGGAYLAESIDACATHAWLMLVGLLGGGSAEVPLRTVLRKRMTIRGTTIRARPGDERVSLAREFEAQLLPLFVSGALRPHVERVAPCADAAAELARLERNETFGKTVLTWESP